VRTLSITFLLSFAMLALDTTMYAGKNPHNVFTIETKDDVSSHYFLEDGKYFFVRAEDILYFFDGENGKEIWKATVPDFEKAGMHVLWGKKKYLVSTEEEEIICYDVYTGKIQWQQKYKDIDQDDYLGYDELRDGVMIQYKGIALFIDVNTGKELWRHDFEPESGRHGKGMYTFSSTDWDTDNRILLSTNDGLFLVDAKTGKDLWTKKKDADLTTEENVKAISHYGTKMLLVYDNDMIGFLDVKNGKELWTRTVEVGDIEGFVQIEDAGGADYLLLSFDEVQTMVNLTTGQVAWESKPNQIVGLMTKYRLMDGGKSVIAYFKQKNAKDESGTYLVLYRIETATGKILYKEKIAFTEWAPRTGFINFVSRTISGRNVIEETNYGFDFDEYEVDGDMVFLIRGGDGAGDMANPLTRKGDGEGLVRINLASGKVAYRSYFLINKKNFKSAPDPIVEGDHIFVVGSENIVAANLKTGKVIWKKDEDLGSPNDWGIVDNTIFLKVGYQTWDVSVNAKSGNIDAKKAVNRDPYRLYAIDAANGKQLWKIDFDDDPGLAMKDGSIKIDPATRILIGASEEELFAVKLTRDAGGKKLWSKNFDKDLKVGELDHEEVYAVTRTSSSSSSTSYNFAAGTATTTTTTSYEATAVHVLYPVLRGDHVVVFGPDGVASVNVADGRVNWKTEWNWAGKKVTLPPQFLSNGKIVFMVKEDIQLMDEKTGKLHWKEEDDYDATPIIPPSNKFLYMMEKDEVRVYKMSE
jgi:outer membrane protein assembly factor BamB